MDMDGALPCGSKMQEQFRALRPWMTHFTDVVFHFGEAVLRFAEPVLRFAKAVLRLQGRPQGLLV